MFTFSINLICSIIIFHSMDLYDSLGMLNSSIQFAGSQIGAVKDKKWIEQENEKSREFQLDMWRRANEYNMPSAVLERFARSGIQVNPNYLVTGKYDGGLTSVASAPGHSAPNMGSKDLAKYANLFQGFAESQQLKMQKQLVDSQISLNESQEAKNIASAERDRSEIPTNVENRHYVQELTTKLKNENTWWDLSLATKQSILNFEHAIKSDQHEYLVASIKELMHRTENNDKLTDMRLTAMSEALAQSWKKLELDERQLVGQLELWAKTGNAAQLQAKAAWLNSLTNSNEFNLEKDKFDKFSDKQFELLKENVSKLRTFNGWYDTILRSQVDYMHSNTRRIDASRKYTELQNDWYEFNLFIPLLGF